MRQKIKRFLSVLCIMTVVASLVTVMPVSAEEVQGTETESLEVIAETEGVEIEEIAETEEAAVTEDTEKAAEPEQLDAENSLTDTVSGNDAIPPTAGSVSGNDVLPEAVSNEAVALTTTELTYTDEQGNLFTYELDEEGNATITGITVSGAALTIPDVISEAPVIAVANGSSCVVSNPEVTIPELTINCNIIGF